MTTPSPLFRLLTPLLQTVKKSPFTALLPRSTSNSKNTLLQPTSRTFTTSQTLLARNDKRVQTDPRITLIRYHLQHPKTPRPLRLSRLRALRHWTIHRAWMLNRRKAKEAAEAELYRMYQSMGSACEALRNLDPPGKKDAGRLYRIAMEKKGIFGHGGVPIEYARHQVDTPAVEAWNHGWTR